ncbi:MAG: DUF4402 domain-containing protein [Bacteroidetes bacterium]|nr:DUF4402 domain-containing protein [Bacteroidota bacterium]
MFFMITSMVYGQEKPPRPISVTVNLSQNLSFGAFYHGDIGGSVIIYSDGSRSSTGDIVLLTMGYSFSTGLYDIVANPGTLISVLNGPDAILTGSNGGSMILQLGDTYPSSPFVVTTPPPASTQLSIGGTLIVGNSLMNPPGNYGGTFDVTLVQE